MLSPADMILRALVLALLGTVALWDYRTQRVPNALVLCLALCSVTLVAVSGETLSAAPFAWSGPGLSWTMLLVLLLPGYSAGMLGAGDVKLLMVLAVPLTLAELLWTIVLAGLSLACVGLFLKRRKLPMAPFLAVGTGAAVLSGALI